MRPVEGEVPGDAVATQAFFIQIREIQSQATLDGAQIEDPQQPQERRFGIGIGYPAFTNIYPGLTVQGKIVWRQRPLRPP